MERKMALAAANFGTPALSPMADRSAQSLMIWIFSADKFGAVKSIRPKAKTMGERMSELHPAANVLTDLFGRGGDFPRSP